MIALHDLGINVRIWPVPVEIPNPIRFDQDTKHAAYDPEHVHRFWQSLTMADTIFKEFRGEFIGKCSPVHFFWGSFDLCVTRFSGRRAPERPGADPITKEAYSHEVSSAGYWPGTGDMTSGAFYSYAAPEPGGFRNYPLQTEGAVYSDQLHEVLLPYDEVRTSHDPRETLLTFLQNTYTAGAKLGKWDRAALERHAPEPKMANG
jgi:hypothetical protein